MFSIRITVALQHEEIKKYLQRITKNQPFLNKYNQEAINSPSEKDDQKSFEQNNATITLNILYTKKKVYPACFKT